MKLTKSSSNVQIVKEAYVDDDIVMSELIRFMVKEKGMDLTTEEITELLEWAGDDEFMTVTEDKQIVLK